MSTPSTDITTRLEPIEQPWTWRDALRAVLAVALLATAAVVGCTKPAHAAEPDGSGLTIGAHLGSWHSRPGYNNINPGLYVRDADGWTVGGYRNSLSHEASTDCSAAAMQAKTGQTKHVGKRTPEQSAAQASAQCDDGGRDRWAVYAGRSFGTQITDGIRADVTIGGVYGYPGTGLLPLVVPSIAGQITRSMAARIAVIPDITGKQHAHVIHAAVEWRL